MKPSTVKSICGGRVGNKLLRDNTQLLARLLIAVNGGLRRSLSLPSRRRFALDARRATAVATVRAWEATNPVQCPVMSV